MRGATEREFQDYCCGETIEYIEVCGGELEIRFSDGKVAEVDSIFDDRYGWETEYFIGKASNERK
jgi:hypothetical protein